MICSNSVNSVFKAFTEFQAKIPTMPKDKNGYGYKYTELDTIVSTIRPLLAQFGLSFTQLPTSKNGEQALETLIIHGASGEFFGDIVEMPQVTMAKTNDAQNFGAANTYMRRYALCSLLGITSDEDVDGNINLTKNIQNSSKNEQKTQKNEQKSRKSDFSTRKLSDEILNLLSATYEDGEPIFPPDYDKIVEKWTSTKSDPQICEYLTQLIRNHLEK